MPDTRGAALTGGWDTRVSRRTLLRTGGSLAAGAVLMGRTSPARAAPPFNADRPFSLGVASGDPTPDGFVLWTRLLPEGSALDGSAMTQEPYGVRYEIAADPDFRADRPPRHPGGALGGVPHGARGDRRAPVGPLVLVPVQVGHGDQRRRPDAYGAGARRGGRQLRFAFTSCQNYARRLLRRPRNLAAARTSTSSCTSATTSTRTSTRAASSRRAGRAASRRRVPLALGLPHPATPLQARPAAAGGASRRCPWLSTWDDHEVVNNYAGLVMNPEVPLEDAKARRAAAYLAYWEHQPLSRSRKPVDDDMPIFRRAALGRSGPFHVIDTRQYRDDQTPAACAQADRDPASGYCHEPDRPDAPDARRRAARLALRRASSASGDAAGTCSPTRSASRPRTSGTAARASASASTAGTATSTSARTCSTTSPPQAHEPRRDHRRQARQLRPRRPAELPLPRRRAGRHGVHRHLDQQRRAAEPGRRSCRSRGTRRSCGRTSTTATCASSSTPEAWRSDFRVIDFRRAGTSNISVWTETSWQVTPDKPGATQVTAV